jgi:drug/metabolite transporter (DMT)-like permease
MNPVPTKTAARLYVVTAAVLWSSSGLFARAPLFDSLPQESRGITLAFWRALFAGLCLLPLARGVRWNWRLIPMTLCFTAMNVTYLQAMVLSTPANAIWLQSTAPLWVFVTSCLLLGERFDRRDAAPLLCGACGVALILFFEWTRQPLGATGLTGVLFGLASGFTYAGVVMLLRSLRNENAAWLVAINHLVAAMILAPMVMQETSLPSTAQLATLAAFGMFQMALPYWLFFQGLRGISSQEAAGIGLLEPVLLPLWVAWAYQQLPAPWTVAGAVLILIGLALRYRKKAPDPDMGA